MYLYNYIIYTVKYTVLSIFIKKMSHNSNHSAEDGKEKWEYFSIEQKF